MGLDARIRSCFNAEFPGSSATSLAGILPLISSIKLFLAPVSIALCEKTSYRLVGMAGGAAFALGLILASQVSSFWAFYAMIAISGFGVSFIYCPGQRLVLKYFDRRRSLAFGVANTGPFFLIPYLFETLLDEYGLKGGLFIYGGLCLNMVVSGFVMRDILIQETHINQPLMNGHDERSPNEPESKILYCHECLAVICLAILAHFAGVYPVFTYLPRLMTRTLELTISDVVIVLTVTFFTEVVARPLSGAILDIRCLREKVRLFIIGSLVVTAASTLTVPFLPTETVIPWLAFAFLFGYFNSLFTVYGNVLIADSFPTSTVSAAVAFFQCSKGVGGIVGPLIAGVLYDAVSVDACFYAASAAFFLAACILALNRPVKTDDQEVTS